jgi:hypothetical protein
MSFVKILGSVPSGDLEIPKLRRAGDGWDEVRELRLETTQAGISGTFFVASTQAVGCKAGKPVMEIISRGVNGTKGYIAECTSYAERVSGRWVGIPGAPAGPHPGNVTLNRVGVTIRWFSSTKPSASNVATAIAPPENFGLPSNPFTWLTDPLYNQPSGWVLDKRDAVPIPGTTYHAVVDYYSYYWLVNPNPSVG